MAAALYVLLPLDAIPDFVPFVGRLDDAIVVTLVLGTARHQWPARLRRLVPRARRTRAQEAA